MNAEWEQNKHGEVRTISVELTERNLNTLLAKLNGSPQDSACTIAMYIDSAWVYVRAVPNEAHYANRTPGRMHDDTERALAWPDNTWPGEE